MRRIGTIFDRVAMLGARGLEMAAERRQAVAPLCAAPLASEAEYLRLWNLARAESYPGIDAYERDCGAAIDAAWFHQLALLTQVVIKVSPLCYQHGRVLYASLRQYLRDRSGAHLNIVETGTARGFSALCMARALLDGGASGKIATFDVLPHDAAIYWNCYRDADGPRTRADLLQDYTDLLEKHVVFHHADTRRLCDVAFPRIHFAFLDSVHTYDHVMAEFAAIRGRQHQGDVLVFDDYSAAYPGAVKAADEICQVHGYTTAVVTATPQRRYLVAERR